jgi:hypothetical protein
VIELILLGSGPKGAIFTIILSLGFFSLTANISYFIRVVNSIFDSIAFPNNFHNLCLHSNKMACKNMMGELKNRYSNH